MLYHRYWNTFYFKINRSLNEFECDTLGFILYNYVSTRVFLLYGLLLEITNGYGIFFFSSGFWSWRLFWFFLIPGVVCANCILGLIVRGKTLASVSIYFFFLYLPVYSVCERERERDYIHISSCITMYIHRYTHTYFKGCCFFSLFLLKFNFSLCMCICLRLRDFMWSWVLCVCVCACARVHRHKAWN